MRIVFCCSLGLVCLFIYFGQGLSLSLELAVLNRLADQRTPGTLLFLPPKAGITRGHFNPLNQLANP